jgi:hypothetical protein
VELRRFEQAEGPLREAYLRASEVGLQRFPATGEIIRGLAEVCDQSSRREEAARWREQLAQWQASTQPATQPTPRAGG